MVDSNLTWDTGILMDEPGGDRDEEACLLVAALAASLVAFRSTALSLNGNGHRPPSRMNWRMMARWGQLQEYL